jgi:hypothetical protein
MPIEKQNLIKEAFINDKKRIANNCNLFNFVEYFKVTL